MDAMKIFEFMMLRASVDDEYPAPGADYQFPASRGRLVTPGASVTSDPGSLRGNGTCIDEDGQICSTVAGIVQEVNKLVSVQPLWSRYNGLVGDLIIGRIVEVQHTKWMVDVEACLNAILLSVPGKMSSSEDVDVKMKHLKVGDVIIAKVQAVLSDGSLLLTRSLKYGKLNQGVMVKVPASLVQREKTNIHNVGGVQIILSVNGNIWLSPVTDVETRGFAENSQHVSKSDRESIARLRNCVLALTSHNIILCKSVISHAFVASSTYEAKEILHQEVMKVIVDAVIQRRELERKE